MRKCQNAQGEKKREKQKQNKANILVANSNHGEKIPHPVCVWGFDESSGSHLCPALSLKKFSYFFSQMLTLESTEQKSAEGGSGRAVETCDSNFSSALFQGEALRGPRSQRWTG